MQAEEDISSIRDGRLYIEVGLALLQFDRGKWGLWFPGSNISYDSLYVGKPFKRQVVTGRRWNEPTPGQYWFLVIPGTTNHEDHELIFDFGDGTTTDRDYSCGTVSPPGDSDDNWTDEAAYTCNARHVFTTPGPKTIRVKVLNKTIGTHPNHPVVEEITTTVNVTDLR